MISPSRTTYKSGNKADTLLTPTMISTGLILYITLAEAVSRGDALHTVAGAWVKAQADSLTHCPAVALALESGAVGEVIPVLIEGEVTWGITIAGPGSLLYLSAATPGLITKAAPAVQNEVVQILGMDQSNRIAWSPQFLTNLVP